MRKEAQIRFLKNLIKKTRDDLKVYEARLRNLEQGNIYDLSEAKAKVQRFHRDDE